VLRQFFDVTNAHFLPSGPFRIYRAPGSVAFLNCQNALRPILPKSQCWAVDDDSSKFVLQVRPPQYWRIEVPNNTPEDKIRAEQLKDVLGKVLRFEKTPCPFQRNFVVELPEAPQTPIIKKPWKPVGRPKVEVAPVNNTQETHDLILESTPGRVASPDQILEGYEAVLVTTPVRASSPDQPLEEAATLAPSSVAHDYAFSRTMAMVFDIESPRGPVNAPTFSFLPMKKETRPLDELSMSSSLVAELPSSPLKSSTDVEPALLDEESVFADFTGFEEDDSYSDATDDTSMTPRNHHQATYQSMDFEADKEHQTPPLQHCSRSTTAPPLLSLVTSPPSKHRTSSPLRISTIPETESGFSSSVESFHSVQSWHSPLAPPSPPASGPSSPIGTYPYPHDNIVLPKRPGRHTRDASELTVTPETPRVGEVNSSGPSSTPRSRSFSPPPKTPTLVPSTSENTDDEQFEILTPPTVRSTIRHRATTSSNSRRRELSPLPAAVNLFSPPRRRSRRLQTARHLPTAIIQKTCEILLSPPSHLLSLMLGIASKIAAGEWRGVLTGQGESVHWDFEDEYAGEAWTEDDYGISLPKAQQKKTKKSKDVPGGSWDVD
jgi:hypothetical protein